MTKAEKKLRNKKKQMNKSLNAMVRERNKLQQMESSMLGTPEDRNKQKKKYKLEKKRYERYQKAVNEMMYGYKTTAINGTYATYKSADWSWKPNG